MRSRARLPIGLLLAVVPLASCSSDSGSPVVATGQSTTSTTAIGEQLSTNGTIEIEGTSYPFMATCYLPGDGNIEVTGAGHDPATGAPVDLLLRNIPAQPYFGMRIAGRMIEASLDSELTFTVDEGRLAATEVEFVRDLDLLSGEGESLGSGRIDVQCDSYVEGSPG